MKTNEKDSVKIIFVLLEGLNLNQGQDSQARNNALWWANKCTSTKYEETQEEKGKKIRKLMKLWKNLIQTAKKTVQSTDASYGLAYYGIIQTIEELQPEEYQDEYDGYDYDDGYDEDDLDGEMEHYDPESSLENFCNQALISLEAQLSEYLPFVIDIYYVKGALYKGKNQNSQAQEWFNKCIQYYDNYWLAGKFQPQSTEMHSFAVYNGYKPSFTVSKALQQCAEIISGQVEISIHSRHIIDSQKCANATNYAIKLCQVLVSDPQVFEYAEGDYVMDYGIGILFFASRLNEAMQFRQIQYQLESQIPKLAQDAAEWYYHDLARFYYTLRDYQNAISMLDQYIAHKKSQGHNPSSLDYVAYAECYLTQGDANSALTRIKEGLKVEEGPEDKFELMVLKGKAFAMLGNQDQSIKSFRKGMNCLYNAEYVTEYDYICKILKELIQNPQLKKQAKKTLKHVEENLNIDGEQYSEDEGEDEYYDDDDGYYSDEY